MRILVTGGAGFVGSHIVDRLVDDGHDVRVARSLLPLPRRHTAGPQPGGGVPLGRRAVTADAVHAVRRGSTPSAIRPRWWASASTSATRPPMSHHNDLGTAVLLAALARAPVPGPHRAREQHGRLRRGPVPVRRRTGRSRPGPRPGSPRPRRVRDPSARLRRGARPGPGPESAPVDPRNVYAATKVHQEHLCAAFGREHDACAIALRYHNVYGPRMPRDTPYPGLPASSAAARGRPPPRVFEDGRPATATSCTSTTWPGRTCSRLTAARPFAARATWRAVTHGRCSTWPWRSAGPPQARPHRRSSAATEPATYAMCRGHRRRPPGLVSSPPSPSSRARGTSRRPRCGPRDACSSGNTRLPLPMRRPGLLSHVAN